MNPWHRGQKVKETDDGLSSLERKALKVCMPLSCANEACVKRYMYEGTQKEHCSHLFDRWQSCFDKEMACLLSTGETTGGPEPPAAKWTGT